MADFNDTRHIETDQGGAMQVPDGSLQPGQVLQSRYRILGIIGMGGMGAVYQARDMHFPTVPKLVAVKEMINLAQDQQLRETTMKNFEREAEILATLNHPAIPQIFDFFSFGDRAYLVMEFIQGKDLEAILNSTSDFLPVDQIREWGVEVCEVLSYLHNHQPEPIVFRDMKPSNVMIDHHRRVRLIDFGIAKTFQMGQPGTMIGTDGYAAPEQYKGLASPAADIYALGATMHHMLTRRDPRLEPPFSFHKRSLQDYNSNIPDALSQVILRAVSYDPEQRYASAEAMKQSLEAANPNAQAMVQTDPTQPQAQAQPQMQPQFAAPQQAVPQQQMVPPAVPGTAAVQTVEPIWEFQVEDAVRSRPEVYDDVVYVSAYDNNVWALNTSDGSLVWKFATEGGIGSSPVYAAGTIYVGSSDGKLYAIDARTGTRRWDFSAGDRIYTTPRVASGVVLFGADNGTIFAVKPTSTSGREMWSYNVMHKIRSSPIVANDMVFFGNDQGEFLAMTMSGELRWRFETRRRVMSSPAVHENLIYIGSDDWYLYGLDMEQGYPIWRFRTRGPVISSPVVADERVFFGSGDGNFYAVQALGGKEIWKYEIGQPVTSSPYVYRDSVYVGAADGALYAFHAATGDLLWKFQSQGPIISSPVVADDVVFVGSDDKRIYALQA